jgi:hypothetical protein
VFGKKAMPDLRHNFGSWQRGITGVEFEVPNRTPIDHKVVVRAMSMVFGAASWAVVNCLDSLIQR